jgi:hypothetical protein
LIAWTVSWRTVWTISSLLSSSIFDRLTRLADGDVPGEKLDFFFFGDTSTADIAGVGVANVVG